MIMYQKLKAKVNFKNIKCDYFLQDMFDIMKKNKALKIVKYNKNLQKRLNLTLNDYKKYSQLYSSIEIELKLINNKYDKFINIPNEDKEYYHIYFDDSKEEIKRNYLEENEKVKTIKIIINYNVKSLNQLFSGCKYISSILFKIFYRFNITDMSEMFLGCSSLKELNLSSFDTSNVIYMWCMFSGCSSLKELNLSNFDTSKVIEMEDMFYGCSSLKELDLSNFDTSNVKDMSGMFNGCSSLK